MAISLRFSTASVLRNSFVMACFWLFAFQPQTAQAQFTSPPPKGNCDPRACHEFANCLADGGFGDISISPKMVALGDILTITFSSSGGSNPSWPAILDGNITFGRGGDFIRWQNETMCGSPGPAPELTRVGNCAGQSSCEYEVTFAGSTKEDPALGGRPWAIIRLDFNTPGGLAWDEDYFGVIEEQEPPEALFTWEQSDTNPLTVFFNGSGSRDPDGDIERYLWDFGDGETSDEEQTSYTYEEYGTYSVSLTVTDDDDLMDTEAQEVKVKPPTEMTYTLTVEPDTAAIGEMVTLTLEVENTGEAELTDIAPTGEVMVESGDGGGMVELTSGPDPETIATLEAGQMGTITWEYETTEAGAVSFSVDAVTGTDPDGDMVEADTNTTCEVGKASTVQACGAELEIDGPSLTVNSISDRAKDDERMGCDTGETITRDGEEEAECTLRAAIQAVNAGEVEAEAGGMLTIPFNIPGASPTITITGEALVVERAVVIDGTTQEGYDAATGQPVVELRGSSANGLVLSAEGIEVRGLAIGSFAGAGMLVQVPGVLIEKNHVGTDRTGALAAANTIGVLIENVPDVMVRDNLISGNTEAGIKISGAGATNTTIEGNRVGVNAAGQQALGNGNGIVIDGARGNVIRDNLIAGHEGDSPLGRGVLIQGAGATGNRLEANLMGADKDLGTVIPNGRDIVIDGAPGNLIGGTGAAARNYLAGILDIDGEAATDNIVQGNYIGTNRDATRALGNRGIILISALRTVIGGSAGAGNLIAGGMFLAGLNNRVEGNLIGALQPDGESEMEGGDCGSGIDITVGSLDTQANHTITNNRIAYCNEGIRIRAGLANLIVSNTIFANRNEGVVIQSGPARGQSIRANAIYRNSGQGIDLKEDGVTLNDSFDGDDGPNGLQNYPVFTSVSGGGSAVTVRGSVPTGINLITTQTYTIEFFSNRSCDFASTSAFSYGEGENYLGSTTATASLGSAAFEFSTGNVLEGHTYITATATDNEGNTSEFSQCRPISDPDNIAQADFDPDTDGLAFDENGVRLTVTGRATGKTGQTTATLFATRYETRPEGNVLSGTSATSHDGSVIIPGTLRTRYYDLVPSGLIDGEGNPIQLTYDLCLDATNQASDSAFERLLLLQRTEATNGVWIPHNTHIEDEGATRYVCAEGLTGFGEFGFGLGSVTSLEAPTLLEPQDRAEDMDARTTLTWQTLPDAVSYDVQLTDVATFIETVLDTTALSATTLQVEGLQGAQVYYWRVRGVDASGAVGPWSAAFTFSTEATSVAIEEETLPEGFALLPNYPNPFNPQTTIGFTLPQASQVRLTVYDILGRQVAVLREGGLPAGLHEATFDASGLPSGMYVYRLEAGAFVQTRRMLLLK